jgi:argininosuccinate synthase
MRKVEDRSAIERIVLAHSGGLESSVAIPWLRQRYGAEVITVTIDLGQGTELEGIRNRALAAGAVRAHVLDAREEFVSGYVLPSLKADALYKDRWPMAASLGRMLIARKLVEIANIEQASAIAHGCTGAEASLGAAARTLSPAIRVIAPACDWGMTPREVIEYGRARAIPLPPTIASTYRTDANLWGRAIAFGGLEDSWTGRPPEDIYAFTKSVAECPDLPASIEIAFERGVPTAINGVEMPMLELIASLVTIAGAHGVGRVDMSENHLPGTRTREVFDGHAAVVLHAAHKDLQRIVLSSEAWHFTRTVSLQYADIIGAGGWFTPLREGLDAYLDKIQERVTGVIRMKLFKGDVEIVGRQSPFALHAHESAVMMADTFARSAVAIR